MTPTAFLEICPLGQKDADAASSLVLASFAKYIAADWEPQGCDTFIEACTPIGMRTAIDAAVFTAGAWAAGNLAAVLLMSRPHIMSMLFVDPGFIGRGCGRALWEAARRNLEISTPEVQTVELNASPYAVRFYRSIGFAPISRQCFRDGARVTRMACWLPARGLGAEL